MTNYLAEITEKDNVNVIDYLFEISNIDLTELQKSFDLIKDFNSNKELLEIVFKNYNDFNSFIKFEINNIIELNREKMNLNNDLYSLLKIDLNKFILNYLFAIRTYLDHNEKVIKNRFTENSVEYKNFKILCSKYFDNYFEYRFIYKLRNYCQHCGLPLSGITTKFSDSSINMILNFNSEYLLEAYNSWSIVKNDLLKIKGNFNALQILSSHKELMEELANEVDTIYKNSLIQNAKSSIRILGENNIVKNVIIITELGDTATKKNIKMIFIPRTQLINFK